MHADEGQGITRPEKAYRDLRLLFFDPLHHREFNVLVLIHLAALGMQNECIGIAEGFRNALDSRRLYPHHSIQ